MGPSANANRLRHIVVLDERESDVIRHMDELALCQERVPGEGVGVFATG